MDIVEKLRDHDYPPHRIMAVRACAADEIERLRAALKPFADLAGKLNGAFNLIGLLAEADFKRAADAFSHEQSKDQT